MTTIGRSDGDRSLAAAVPETRDPAPAPLEPAGARPPAGRGDAPGSRRPPESSSCPWPWRRSSPTRPRAAGVQSNADVAAARVVSAAEMEQDYGIKVDLVAVTAAGGLVDLRFTVVDQAKALHILHDATVMPALLVEPSGTVIRAPTGMRHKVTVLDGGNYFILYSNPGGAVQAGTHVSVVIGDVRLEPLDAQS